eukprot:m.218940 g.218940  ORF g.218940 m.218940 type:complete len:912 (+) comp39917_c0_seq2:96-2831(+)
MSKSLVRSKKKRRRVLETSSESETDVETSFHGTKHLSLSEESSSECESAPSPRKQRQNRSRNPVKKRAEKKASSKGSGTMNDEDETETIKKRKKMPPVKSKEVSQPSKASAENKTTETDETPKKDRKRPSIPSAEIRKRSKAIAARKSTGSDDKAKGLDESGSKAGGDAASDETHAKSESEVEWEEVADLELDKSPIKERRDGSFEVIVDLKRSKSRVRQIEKALELHMRRVQADMHKVHLLCLLNVVRDRSSFCSNQLLQAASLSLVPLKFLGKKRKSSGITYVKELASWFCSAFKLKPSPLSPAKGLILSVMEGLGVRQFGSALQFAMAFLAMIRAIGMMGRLVSPLQAVPLKWSMSVAKEKPTALSSFPKKLARTKQKRKRAQLKETTPKKEVKVKTGKKAGKTTQKRKNPGTATQKSPSLSTLKKEDSDYEPFEETRESSSDYDEEEVENEEEAESMEHDLNKLFLTPKSCSDSDSDDVTSPAAKKPRRSDKRVACSERQSAVSSAGDKSFVCDTPKAEFKSSVTSTEEYSFIVDTPKSLPRRPSRKKARKSKSSTKDDSGGVEKTWVEVYVESERRWICVCPALQCVDDIESIQENCSDRIDYVISVDNDGSVKDLTARYVSDWLTAARKRQVDSNWWKETLQPYKTSKTERDNEENQQIQACLEKLPFPTSIGEFKDHPLYVLKRHVLKKQALYPDDPPVLGYIKREAIFPREYVKPLCSRETWLKHGMAIKQRQIAYKRVKKPRKKNEPEHFRNEYGLELFGEWQVEKYKAPPAVNGKVPRNAFGNVDLLKPWMLPPGTVHIVLPDIYRIARKLGIDCPKAHVSWDLKKGFIYPLFEGIVICKECESTLLEAYEREREELRKKASMKKEKVIYERWRKLVRGMTISVRLKKKYKEFNETQEENV